jgi:hypothetical protein
MLIASASLPNVDQTETVVVENIHTSLLPEIYWLGRFSVGWDTL